MMCKKCENDLLATIYTRAIFALALHGFQQKETPCILSIYFKQPFHVCLSRAQMNTPCDEVYFQLALLGE